MNTCQMWWNVKGLYQLIPYVLTIILFFFAFCSWLAIGSVKTSVSPYYIIIHKNQTRIQLYYYIYIYFYCLYIHIQWNIKFRDTFENAVLGVEKKKKRLENCFSSTSTWFILIFCVVNNFIEKCWKDVSILFHNKTETI